MDPMIKAIYITYLYRTVGVDDKYALLSALQNLSNNLGSIDKVYEGYVRAYEFVRKYTTCEDERWPK